MTEAEAALYEAPFEYVRRIVRPERVDNRRAAYAERWWLHGRAAIRDAGGTRGPRPVHRDAAADKAPALRVARRGRASRQPGHRYCARRRLHLRRAPLARPRGVGPRTWDPARDAAPLHARPPVSRPSRSRDPTAEQREAIAAAARELVDFATAGSTRPASTPRTRRRTLTNLYNARPTWLQHAHAALDRAVLAAYGWPDDLAGEPLLAALPRPEPGARAGLSGHGLPTCRLGQLSLADDQTADS